MFESLHDRLQNTFRSLSGKARLSESHIKDALREVRLAFLEADVNYSATKDFCKRVEERALGADVLKSLTPAQQVIKIVNEEMIELLGGDAGTLELPSGEVRIMLVGLQGSGKTTTCAKLAKKLIDQEKRNPLLCAGDIYRPAAIEQLEVMGGRAGVPVFQMGTDADPVKIANEGTKKARKENHDVVILDTAGRLHIDQEMMDEVKRVQAAWKPTHTILVVDSMVGQDAVNQAKQFSENLELSGTILTKLDSDTRGGAALSIRYVTGKPILYAGVGEKLEDFEPFYPDRMASRILGMGDMLTLIEKAQSVVDEKQAEDLQKKILNQTFTLDDFLNQIRQVKRMGGIGSLMSLMPGMGGNEMTKQMDMGESEMKKTEAIICSMTEDERTMPRVINGSRKRRIAKGSGTTVQQVNRLLKQFTQTKEMMGMLSGGNKKGGKFKKGKKPKMNKKMMRKMQGMKDMFPGGGGFPG